MFKNYFYYLLISLLMYSCASTRVVKPLEKGRVVTGAGIAVAPFFLTTIPITFLSLYGAYGISNKVSVHTGINFTLLPSSILNIDLGGTYGIIKQKKFRPGLSAVTNFNFVNVFIENYSFSMFPELELNAFWEYGKEIDNDKKFMSYLNFKNIFDILPYIKIGNGSICIPALTLGQQFNRKKFIYNLELKYFFANQPNLEIQNDISIRTFGIFFGIKYKFNLKKKI